MLGAQLDFQGVILLMWGASVPTVFYSTPCDAELRRGYWKLVSLLHLLGGRRLTERSSQDWQWLARYQPSHLTSDILCSSVQSGP
jgi:hypothetical protein